MRLLRLTKEQKKAMQLKRLEFRKAQLTKKIAALRDERGNASGASASHQGHNERQEPGSGDSSGEEEGGEDEKEDMDAAQASSREANVIGNQEEVEAEQEDMDS